MNTRKNIALALTGGLLLGLPWSVSALFFLVFIGWVPLVLLEAQISHHPNRLAIFNYAFAAFLLWNIIGTWWVAQAQLVGAVLIIIANSLLQALVFWLASRIRTILRVPLLFTLLPLWMGYETFSPVLGSGLALAQPGQRPGHGTHYHPVVRDYRSSGGKPMDYIDQFRSHDGLRTLPAQ